jgi:hypothetical protein
MKKWYLSKTLWFNFIVIMVEVLQLLASHHLVSPEYVALIDGLGNIFLRFVTREPIVKKTPTIS